MMKQFNGKLKNNNIFILFCFYSYDKLIELK